jgi:hypothetical protein
MQVPVCGLPVCTEWRETSMTAGKICPIMSRPMQGDVRFGNESLWSSEEEMIKYGYTVIEGIPYSSVFPCLKEKCRAWVDGGCLLIEY